MKKELLFLLAILAFSFGVVTNARSQAILFEDDFDSYTVGEHLAVQNPAWTTWGNNPGSPEDPLISDEQAFSATQSVVIEGTNDCILPLGDKTDGKYWVNFKIYVPDGYFGYFNLLHLFAGASSEWGIQVYFDAGGLGTVDAGGAGAGAFSYNYDEWITVENSINIDDDWAQLYINSTLVIEWQWSLGTFGTPGLNQLGALNLYAWDANGTPKYFVDNVVYEQVTAVLIDEDFEAYNIGEQLVEQAVAMGIDYWTTWSNDPGSAEDPFVTDEQYLSGEKSIVVEGMVDAVMLFDDKTAGKYSVKFDIYVPTGYFGYYNLLHLFAGASSEWGTQVFFDAGGLGTIDAGGQGAGVFNYNYDEWIEVDNIIDLNNDWAQIFIGGNMIIEWQWSLGCFGTPGLNQLGAMDLFAYAEAGTPKAFFDDIVFTEIEGPGGDPVITVDPASLSENLDVGQTSTQTLTIGNEDGLGDLDFDIAISYVVSQKGGNGGYAKRSATPEPKFKSEVYIGGDSFSVTDLPGTPYPGGANEDEVILHYDGDNASAVGMTNGGTWEVAAMFPAAMVGDYIGMEMTEVDVYINDMADAFKLKIYGQDNPNAPGALLYEQVFTPQAEDWHTIVLDNPVVNTGGDIWVAYEIVQNTAGIYPAGTDAGPHVFNGDWIKTGPSWAQLHAISTLDYNWNIRAKLVGEPISAWLSVDPASGTVVAGESEDIEVAFNATNLETGTYVAHITITSNDPVTPSVVVPVTLIVGGTPPVTIAELNFEEVEDWSLTFDPWTALDVDGGATYGFSGISFPHAYEPMAYIAFNPATTEPPMIDDPEIQPHAGVRFGACMASVPPPGNDDWLISPQVQLGENSLYNLWVKSYTDLYGLEKYNIGVSTTGMNPEDFDIISGASPLEAPVAWEEKTFDLSVYDGQLIYVGIQCVSYDAFVFMVDDITISSLVGINEVEMNADIKVYPNPATNFVNIRSDVELKSVKMINYTGQVVYNEMVFGNELMINTSDLPSGIYFLQMETPEGMLTQKLIVE